MVEAVRVLDRRRWSMNLYWADFVALGVFAVVVVNLFYDMYTLGASAYAAATGIGVYERDQLVARMIGQSFLAALSFGWVAYRIVVGGYRAIESRP